MKSIALYILFALCISFASLGLVHASSNNSKGEVASKHTPHPPHTHHETDHIKKLDEAMRRKPEDDEKSHL